jgi:NAD-dependent dihydropyrimidine dehydrogenase PreA subunit
MTYVIAEPCVDVMDQACVAVCPVDCIHFDEGTDRILYIDPNECIDCGACEPECPVTAIFGNAAGWAAAPVSAGSPTDAPGRYSAKPPVTACSSSPQRSHRGRAGLPAGRRS